MKKPMIISILNQKGGSGKTSVSVNLASSLALEFNKKILLLDLDLQANATSNLIGYKEKREYSLARIFKESKAIHKEFIYDTAIENLKIIPSDEQMMDVDIQLVAKMARERILEQSLKSKAVDQFDFIFADNPPYISLISLNSLACSDYVLVPITPSYFSLFGLKLLQKTVTDVQSHLNPNLKILGFILNAYDKRKTVSRIVIDSLKQTFSDKLFHTRIRVNTNFEIAPSKLASIFEYEDPNGKGVEDYTELGREFLERMDKEYRK